MSAKWLRWIGVTLIVVGLLVIVAGAAGGSTSDRKIDAAYPRTATTDDGGTWSCAPKDPIEVGRELRESLSPLAYSEHEGRAYLRMKRRIIEVGRDNGECVIRAEGLTRYRSGGFAYVGPGFVPSSPAGGSGGSSGSGGGVK